jgi:hypothetical protein
MARNIRQGFIGGSVAWFYGYPSILPAQLLVEFE